MAQSTKWLIVGGGAAGCVVASRLSEDPSNEVVLLEAGPDHPLGPIVDRGGPLLDEPDKLYPGIEVVRRPGAAAEPYLQGYGLGGSSLVHGALATPDPSIVVEHLLPLEQAQRLGTLGAAMLSADRRARPAVFTRRDGQRVTAADAYLRPALSRPNLFVITGSPVDRVVVDGWTADRVITTEGIEYRADRIVLCAGAIGSAAILLRSGLDTPGIGEGLQDHPTCVLTLELEPGSDVDAPVLSVVTDRPHHQLLPLNHLPGAPGRGALVVALMTVSSTGRLTVDGAGVRLELNAFATHADRAAMTEAAVDAIRVVGLDPVREVVRAVMIDEVGTPLEAIADDPSAVAGWACRGASGLYHASSTCREGIVTDPFGRVLGYDALYVCDASLFSSVPARNPYLPVVQLAERLVATWRAA